MKMSAFLFYVGSNIYFLSKKVPLYFLFSIYEFLKKSIYKVANRNHEKNVLYLNFNLILQNPFL
jgi:hypothetical protein